MMHIIVFVMAFLAVKIFGLEAPIPGYAVMDIVWDVDPFNNGTIVHIPGTVQQVHQEILKINPGFVMNHTTTHETTASDHDLGNEARDDVWCHDPWGWEGMYTGLADDVIAYLRNIPGRPGLSPGPGECGRVSCNVAAIWWCNDNTHSISIDSFNTLADCALVIRNACKYMEPVLPPNTEKTKGQNFIRAEGWNCILRRDDTCNS
ncbi:hypothetical protein V8F06_007610 [Rhypophila decipiens]